MRFKKTVPTEMRELLKEQLKQYKKEVEMTKEELHDLEDWVSSGRSPYDNGDYICTDGGYPLDFISAERLQKEETAWFNSLSEEERKTLQQDRPSVYDTTNDDIFYRSSDYEKYQCPDQEEELPFN